jgi:Methyltransferase domain
VWRKHEETGTSSAHPTNGAGSTARSGGFLASSRISNGLKEFLRQLQGVGRGTLLDVGPVSHSTVKFFVERGFKLYTEDVLVAWRDFLQAEEKSRRAQAADSAAPPEAPGARAQRFLETNLTQPADSVDAILLWDLLDYLDADSLPVFLARLSSILKDGGAILAMFNTRLPQQLYRYRVVDDHNLELLPSPLLVPPQHIYQNREIQLLFERFRSSKSFVGRDQFREGIFVK